MPAFSVSVQPQVKVALLRDAHIGKHAPGCTPQGAVKHGCRTFVEEPFGTDAALLKDGCKLGCACACGLLVGAEGEDYGATRTVPTSKKVLKRLELPHEHVLDVERSPAPDEGLVKIPGEGVVQPVLLRASSKVDAAMMCGNEEHTSACRRSKGMSSVFSPWSMVLQEIARARRSQAPV